jgi:DNA uptake protein ComE-like DNA-binding protein
MKPALVFALGALGLFALAKYQKQGGRGQNQEQPAERVRRPRARRMRSRHRSEDGLLDLNSATLFELKELKGIGDALAGRIIENRPYTTKIDLIGRRVIPDSAYEVIKQSITVRHAA